MPVQRHAIGATECTAAALHNATDVCAYARLACSEVGVGLFGSYIAVWHCELGGLAGWLPLLAIWLVIIIYALGTTADSYLIPQLNYLSALLKLSPDVAGVTLLAFGNGAPDVFTGIAVATQSEDMDFSLLLSDLVGGSVFIMTVVVGAVIWIAHKHAPGWRVDPLPFWRDGLSFIVALSAVAMVAVDGTVYLPEAVGFLGLYLLYIGIVLALPPLLRRFGPAPAEGSSLTSSGEGGAAAAAAPAGERRGQAPALAESAEGAEKAAAAAAPLAGLEWESEASLVGRGLWLLSLPLSVLRAASIPSSDGLWDQRRRLWTLATPPLGALVFLLLMQGDVHEVAVARVGGGALPVAVLVLVLGVLGSAALWLGTSGGTPPRWLAAIVASGFVMTVVWLNLLANEMVALVEAFGVMLGVSTSILGLTVIAIGNSVGDLVTDSAAARGADARMAMAACFGSPLVMNVLGVGIALSLRMLTTNGAPVHAAVSPQCRLAYVVLYGSLLAHLVTFPLAGYRAPRFYAACLFALYAAFLLLSCLAEAGVVKLDFLCGAAWPCPEHPEQAQWYRTVAHANRNARMAMAGATRNSAHRQTLLVPGYSAWAPK
jgi:sodium/potassium/calcium exchanger 6